jgi:hypothetical protein
VTARAKKPPQMKVDPLKKYTSARKAAEKTSRSTGAKGKGTFAHGTKSATSSHAGARHSRKTGRFI